MIRRRMVVLACAAMLAACGDEAASPAPDAGQPEETSNSIEVTAENFAFSPPTVPVEGGADIDLTFVNADSTQHSFTADELDLDLVVEGGSSDATTFTAPDSGSVDFVCKFHDTMRGTITADGAAAGGGGDQDQNQDLDY